MDSRPEVAEQVQQFVADTPLGRMASVDELVGPTVFLLSESASFCTGVDLLVDRRIHLLVAPRQVAAQHP